MKNELTKSYAEKNRTPKEICEACKFDIFKIYGHNTNYKNIVVDAVIHTFRELISDHDFDTIESMIDESIDLQNYIQYVDDNDTIFPDVENTIIDILETLIRVIDKNNMIDTYCLHKMTSSEIRAYILKKVARTITSKVIMTREFYSDVLSVIPKIETVYVSNGFEYDSYAKEYVKITTGYMPKHFHTDNGTIDSEQLAVSVAELLGVCKYSISKYHLVNIMFEGCDEYHYTSIVNKIKSEFIDIINSDDVCEYLINDKKHGWIITSKILLDMYDSYIRNDFVDLDTPTRPYKKEMFYNDLGVGEEVQKKYDGKVIKFRKITFE